jgi:hypothetical protein
MKMKYSMYNNDNDNDNDITQRLRPYHRSTFEY